MIGRLLCALGLHSLDVCSGVGPCQRPGCAHVEHARVLRAGWRKYSVPPRPVQRPRGFPPKP